MSNINQKARNKLTQALTSLLLDEPFFGTLAMKLELIERTDIPTEATNGKQLFYNPTFIESIPFEQVKAEICHEVCHCAKLHQFRRDGRDAKLWNVACDFVINNELKTAGYKLDATWLLNPLYAGMSEEQVYTQVAKQSKKEQEEQQKKSDGHGQVLDAQETLTEGTEQQKQEWQQSVIQVARQTQQHGTLPGFAQALIKEFTHPIVDWRAATRKFIEQTARNDFTWTRPARNYVQQGLYLPSLKSDKLPPIVYGFDTSGSRWSKEQQKLAASELVSIIQEARPEKTYVVYFDSQVKSVEIFEAGDIVDLHPKGGGGTNFECVFKYIQENEIEPCCAIFMTDLEGNFPAEIPEFPVLWACDVAGATAPFGEVLDISHG